MKKLIFILPILLLSACFRGQQLAYPFKDVAVVLKNEFTKNKDDFEYHKPEIEEKPGYLYLYQPKYIDFYLILHITIKLKEDGENKNASQIMIRINEYNRQWKYGMRDKDMEKDFFKALEKRMETGKWGILPWDNKYKRKPNEFQ